MVRQMVPNGLEESKSDCSQNFYGCVRYVRECGVLALTVQRQAHFPAPCAWLSHARYKLEVFALSASLLLSLLMI